MLSHLRHVTSLRGTPLPTPGEYKLPLQAFNNRRSRYLLRDAAPVRSLFKTTRHNGIICINTMQETWLQSSARAAVLNVLRCIQEGRLTIIARYLGQEAHPEVFGSVGCREDHADFDVIVTFNNPNAWVRICQAFDLGFSEAYMMQELDCDDLISLFSLYISNRTLFTTNAPSIIHTLLPRLTHYIFRPSNSVSQSQLHASFHYDTSNKLFTSFLSPDLNYSSALWSPTSLPSESLESAQNRKVQNIISLARISSSDHVLDIGCGWAHLAIEAVKRTGCRVTGLTLSKEQVELGRQRVKNAGLEGRIEILLCDYRQAPRPDGGYDRVVSVEMVEHVGLEFLDGYFGSISNLLKPKGGVMVVQGITGTDAMSGLRPNVDTFIDRYVFPGGYCPSINQLLTSLHAGSKGTLEVKTVQSIGPHYIKTLATWRENFLKNWDVIEEDFIDEHPGVEKDGVEAYRRRWLYYFQYCEAGFRSRIIGDHVVCAVRTPEEVVHGDMAAELLEI